MYLIKTIFFIPQGDTVVQSIKIYISDDEGKTGFWNTDTNAVLLSAALYAEFNNLPTQSLQKQFFQQLMKIP